LENKSGYLTGRKKPFLANQNEIDLATVDFGGQTKVYIMENLKSSQVTLEDRQNGKQVQLGFSGFPYLGIWSPSNQAPLICMEPWYGITGTLNATDILNRKRGIQGLDPGKCFACSYEIICL
jgi:galactose mutarotase-like enzyme